MEYAVHHYFRNIHGEDYQNVEIIFRLFLSFRIRSDRIGVSDRKVFMTLHGCGCNEIQVLHKGVYLST